MPRYRYQAIAGDGRRIAGEVTAADEPSALDSVVALGHTPISIIGSSSPEQWWNRDIDLLGFNLQPALLDFIVMLGFFLRAKVPVAEALKNCLPDITNTRVKQSVRILIERIEDGATLAEALPSAEAIPADIAAALIVGERANKLYEVCNTLTETLRSNAETAKTLRTALIYPAILAIVSCLVMCLLIFFLAPTIEPLFAGAGVETPFVIDALVSANAFLTSFGVMLGLAIVAMFAAITVYRRTAQRRFTLGLGRFLFKHRQQLIATLELVSICSLMLRSGAGLREATNVWLLNDGTAIDRSVKLSVHSMIGEGEKLSRALMNVPEVLPRVLRLIAAGENSDTLPQVLDVARQSLERDIRESTSRLVAVATPVITIVLGILVGSVILSTVAGVMRLNDLSF